MSVGIRHESKSVWERRTAIPPEQARALVERGIPVVVQRSDQRIFTDNTYTQAGASLTDGIPDVNLLCGIKEMPIETFRPGGAYLFFAHVIKGQPYNMDMLATLIERGCTLIDYEKITDADGRRLVFFGREAGLAGMVDSLWSLGEKLTLEGIPHPFAAIRPTHQYAGLEDALESVREAGATIREKGLDPSLVPFVVGITGDGNVARGVKHILSALPITVITPEALRAGGLDDAHTVYQVTFKEREIARRPDGGFDIDEYYATPDRYESGFGPYRPHLSMLMNCIYWTEDYPRLVTEDQVEELARCYVIGDISCDVEGAIAVTKKGTEPGDPVYTWLTKEKTYRMGVHHGGPVICAVDILPAELPREASERFAAALDPYLVAMATADYSVPFAALDLPAPIKRAVIVHNGMLTPEYAYLREYLTE